MRIITFLLSVIFFSCNSGNNTELERRLTQLENENKDLKQQNINEKNNTDDNVKNQYNTISTPKTSNNSDEITAAVQSILNTKKYVYVVIKTKEPKLDHREGIYIPSRIGEYGSETKSNDLNIVVWEDFVYTSEVQEIANFDEDKKFKLLDKAEASAQQNFINKNISFRSEVFMKVHDKTERSQLENNIGEIVDRKAYVFDTYKQASEHRNKNKGKF